MYVTPAECLFHANRGAKYRAVLLLLVVGSTLSHCTFPTGQGYPAQPNFPHHTEALKYNN
jgi:hypothetical protein